MLKILILAVAAVVLFFIRGSLIPLAVGISIAYILDPYVAWLSKKLKLNRVVCIFLAYLSVLAAAILLIWGFADIIAGKIAAGSLSAGTLKETASSLQLYYDQYKGVIKDIFGFSPESIDMGKLVQSLGSGAVNFFIGSVAGVYLLKDKDFFLRLGNQTMHLLLPQKPHGLLREVLFEINEVISAFLRGVFVDSVIVAFLSSLVLSLLGVEFAVFIGCFAGIANVIPYFGPVLGIVPAFLSALLSSGLPLAVLAAVSLFAIQQIECNFIYPRIIGKSTGLHPLFVLTAVSVAGALGGLLWMILAVPIAGIIKVLLCKWAEAQ